MNTSIPSSGQVTSPGQLIPVPVVRSKSTWRLWLVALTAFYYLSLVLFPVLFRVIAVDHLDQWFFDSFAILASNDAAALGRDVHAYNPLDPTGRPHVYTHWWLGFQYFGITRDHNIWVGGAFVLMFFTAAFSWLRPRSGRELIWYLVVLWAPSMVLAVERANNDLTIFALLTPVVAGLCHSRAWVRWISIIPIFVAVGLKFYPAAAALILCFGDDREEVRRRVFIGALLLAVVFFDLRFDLVEIGRLVPKVKGLMSFGATQIFSSCGIGLGAGRLLALMTGAGITLALRPWRWFAGWQPTVADRPAWLGFMLGASVLTGCFFAGTNYGYRWIFALWLAPLLWRLLREGRAPRAVRRLAVVTTGFLLLMLWVEGMLGNMLRGLLGEMPDVDLLALAIRTMIVMQVLVWGLMICLLAFLAHFVRSSVFWRSANA